LPFILDARADLTARMPDGEAMLQGGLITTFLGDKRLQAPSLLD
jgi:hypothetical protein